MKSTAIKAVIFIQIIVEECNNKFQINLAVNFNWGEIMNTVKEIFINIPYPVILTLISTTAASFTAYFTYRAIRLNVELQEQNSLPLFDVHINSVFLNEKGHLSNENPDPENIISLYFVNISHNSIAGIMATEENDESDIEPLVSPKNIRAINYTPNGVVLSIVENKIEDKDYKITIKYQIQANKHYNSELIVSASHGVFFYIKEQNAKKTKKTKGKR